MPARFDKDTVERWRKQAEKWLATNLRHVNCSTVFDSRTAWTVAHRCGIVEEAYKDRTVTDEHIATALRKIFPNAKSRLTRRT